MRWIRSNRRGGALLALAGLVFQIVVALGHVHVAASATAPVLKSATLADGMSRGDRAPTQHPDANCDICAVLHMASAAEVSTSPSLAVPHLYIEVRQDLVADRSVTTPRRFLAQSRAPPIV